MLYETARTLLFKLDAEHAHEVTMKSLRWSQNSGAIKLFRQQLPTVKPVKCMGLTFPNPVGLAAGLDKEGNTIDALGSLGFGFVEIGTITPRPQDGNPQPRLFRIVEKEAIINRMGFNNPGIDQGVENVRASRSFQGVIGFNIGKNKVTPNESAVDDYVACLRAAYPVADYVAVNISSPNTPGLRDLQSADATAQLITALRTEQETLTKTHGKHVPIVLKVAPDLTDEQIRDLSKVFLETGLEGLITNNTTLSREAVSEYAMSEQAGGLSGAPLTQRSLEVLKAFKAELGSAVPIISVGGIMDGRTAVERLDAGASLVQLYTGFVYGGPPLVKDILTEIANRESGRNV